MYPYNPDLLKQVQEKTEALRQEVQNTRLGSPRLRQRLATWLYQLAQRLDPQALSPVQA